MANDTAYDNPRRGRALRRLGLAGLLLSALTGAAGGADNQPTLSIFPTQVIDNIRETGVAAKALEDNLQDVIENLDRQQKLYKESRCDGAMADAGCREISRQMAQAYGRMLDIMAGELPKMEQRITLTRDALEKRVLEELGRNRTGAELQQLLHQDNSGIASSQRTRVRREGVRLSDRFRQYYRLVNQGTRGSMALIATQMYLDLVETSDLIALTRQEIERGRLVANLSESFGTITPGMQATVSGVKQMLFGESLAADDKAMPADVRVDPQTGFCSEFDPNCP